MQAMVIQGKRPLRGEAVIHGAKNSALPILAACLLPAGCSAIAGVPEIADVHTALEIAAQLGCRVQREGERLLIGADQLTGGAIAPALSCKMRSSILFLGSLLARCGEAAVPLPGGCALGPRPIDLHLQALAALGATVRQIGGRLLCRLPRNAGGTACLPYPSVGATENLMLAACGCGRPVTIENAACEPEIADLGGFLAAMGMEVRGAGSRTVCLARRGPLHGAAYRVMPDRIETATYLCAAAATGGEVRLCHVRPQTLQPVLAALRRAGCCIETGRGELLLRAPARLRGVGTIVTAPYPGFPTDAQPPLVAALAGAAGQTRMVETVFSGRYQHVPALCCMGAQIRLDGRIAVIDGVQALHGARVEAKDLRGGAALVIAALQAEGESTIFGLQHLRRGYMDLEKTMKILGADIKTVEIP